MNFFPELSDLPDIVLRSVLSLVVLFLIARFMGKKQISQLTFFDYTIGISIGSIAAEMASTDEEPYLHALIAMIIYGLIAILISVITNKSIKARRFFTGRAFLLVQNGKILERNLAKAKLDVNDLLAAARIEGYFDLSDIAYGVLETNGRMSFLPTASKTPVTAGDIGIQLPQASLCANIIIDGVIMRENLKTAGFDETWLSRALSEQHAPPTAEIILACVDQNGALTVYPRTNRAILKSVLD